MCTPRSQSVGAAEGALGDSGWGCVKEAAGEYPPPQPAAEETQASLSLTLQEPGERNAACHVITMI